MYFTMKEHLERAKKHYKDGSSDSRVYACLELRLAIEKIVKEKVDYYSKRHGLKLFGKYWQANKAMKTLKQLEPHADQSYTVQFKSEDSDEDWKNIGKHEALSVKWIKKNIHKLGYFLHAGENIESEDLNIYLEKVILELERVNESSLNSNFAETITFKCTLCDAKTICNVLALPELDEIHCSNEDCHATFDAVLDDGHGWRLNLQVIKINCLKCGKELSELRSEMAPNFKFKCNSCDTMHMTFQYLGYKILV